MKDNLTQIAIDLKKAGYPQALTYGDNFLILKTKEYVRFTGQEIDDDFIRVPTLASLMSSLKKREYVLCQSVLGEVNGEVENEFTIKSSGHEIKSDNIWAVMAKLWIFSKSL